MRLGPKEKQLLKKLIPGEFVPPSIYLVSHDSCPSGNHSLNRIVYDKRLAVFRHQTQTPEQRKHTSMKLRPGYEAAEYNAALRPTLKGEQIITSLIKNDA